MKRLALLAALSSAVVGLQLSPVSAQDFDDAENDVPIDSPSDSEKPEKPAKPAKPAKDAKAGANAVAAAVKKCKTVNGKPNAKAQFYIYLSSASWCGPCQAEMPRIVEAYKEMKKDGRCEIILIGCDHSVDDMKAYLKIHKAKFSGIWVDDKNVDKLPGYKKDMGIPNAIFVTRDGKVLSDGHGSTIMNWKEIIGQAGEGEM